MALCDLCQTVPFTALPRLSQEGRWTSLVANSTDNPRVFWLHVGGDVIETSSAELPDPIGFPFHKDLDALALSARSCPVCKIAQAGVQGWIDRWEDAAKNDKAFIEFDKLREPIPRGQQLWLTACDDGEQGFVLWAKNPTKPKFDLYMLAAQVVWLGNFQSARFMKTRLLIVAWSRRCSQESNALPTRVLDIGSNGDFIKLVDGTHHTGRYASLSYCRGQSPPYLTSRDNLAARHSGFNVREMPRTFVDAIKLARRLGLRYLWIDSLCICQDDAIDWARESSRMAAVYSNAHIVIAANRSDDCTGGLFHSREPRPSAVFRFHGGSDDVYAMLLFQSDQQKVAKAGEFQEEPLTSRGWALQERILGKRIIHYNARQVYFECDHGIFAEDGSSQKDRYCAMKGRPVVTEESSADRKDDLAIWNSLVWVYGRRTLSKPADKMPAMSGLARLFHKRLGGEYVAGLWSKAMMEGLAWQPLGRRGPASRDQYTGPSWSWASYDGIAATGLKPGWVDVAQILDWHVDLKHEANPFGEVENAWVRIRGPIVQLRHSTLESNEHESRLRRADVRPLPRVCSPYSESENGLIMKPDHAYITESSEWKEWRLEVLLLGGYKEDSRSEPPSDDDDDAGATLKSFYGLAVRSVGDEGTDQRQRVGFVFFEGTEGTRIRDEEKNWKTVKLI
ncbi:hypothetical protein diail_8072 [Diaporthe ilicicola]|nr:hypothetical protein diail_8072 [Diaporthe ilicicola]